MKNTKQVSILLKIAERTVRLHAHNLKVKKVGRDYIFMPEDIEKVKARIGRVGRPVHKKEN